MAAQEWQSILAWNPMNEEAITLAAEPPASVIPIREEIGRRGTPLEAVARALGYTETEMTLAGSVLNRFAWRQRS